MNASHNSSITARITLFTGVVAALMCTLLAVVLMIAIHRFATGELTEEVRATSGRVALNVEQQDVLDYPLAHRSSRNVQIVDNHGRVVTSTPELRGRPPMATLTPDAGTSDAVVCDGVFGPGRCDIVVAQSAHRPEGTWTVYTSSPAIPVWVEPWLAALVTGSAIVLALSVTYLGNRIVTASLRPVSAIRRELDEINASCPGRQVPVPGSDDEIHELADSINHTLTRLEAAMEQQRQFAFDASHDLRSPIAAMRAEVEDALMAPQETSVPILGTTVLTSLDRLESIVSDLLTIARLDAGTPSARVPVNLAELVDEECRMRHQTTKRIVCRLDPGVVVLSDRLRLGRLFTNLLDNADRHAERTISVNVRQVAGEEPGGPRCPQGVAVLEVIDDGPGIEPDKRELVFQRFARLDAARSKDAGGTGLGLPIARQIAEADGGTLRIEDSDRGACFTLRLPRHPKPPAPTPPTGPVVTEIAPD
ncbi:sensor histidine kinase [Nonomuraea jiangxiensis]|uniref:histidine kinase n=1 Tax=Nonomuraea jiangxiensis TaxID=633440 RepID=A0A1G9G546_9ACTN|nr:HAMP domain-containing sensor histidine kinase [Nonomuraea jiangxiensis]SDK95433.1 Signal transduction histidine kinase [Nonomuraea jiangxiensis]